MSTWRRGVSAAVVCVAMAAVAVPAGARPAAPSLGATPVAAFWEVVKELWSGLTAVTAPEVEAAATAPVDPIAPVAGGCDVACTEQSHDIDPNG